MNPRLNKELLQSAMDECDKARFGYVNDQEYELAASCRDAWAALRHLLCKLPPLAPAPTYRAYTPVEAAAHLGRTFRQCGFDYVVKAIWDDRVIAQKDQCVGHAFFFQYMATDCTWADTGLPCGVQE